MIYFNSAQDNKFDGLQIFRYEENHMFRNIGEKIKILAIVCTVLGCLLSVAIAIVCWCTKNILAGFIVIIGGCLLSWIGTFLLYGFGELISQTTKVAKGVQNMQILSVYQNSDEPDQLTKEKVEEIQNEVINECDSGGQEYVDEFEAINKPNSDECPSCFCKISPEDEECPNCGYKLK